MLKFTDDECLAVIAEAGIAWDIPFPSVDVRDPLALIDAQDRGYRSLAVRDLVRYEADRTIWVPEIQRVLALCHEATLIGRILPAASFDTAPELIVCASGAVGEGGLTRIDANGVHTVEFVEAGSARRAVLDAGLEVFESEGREFCFLLADDRSGGAWVISPRRVQNALWVDGAWAIGAEASIDEVYAIVTGEPAAAAA